MKMYLSLIAAAALSLSACDSKPAAPATSTTVAASEAATAASEAATAASEAATAASEAATAASEAATAASEAATAEKTAEAAPAASGDCKVTIDSDDAMKYDPKEITVPSSCKQFSITLKHNGKMPAAAMGHNVVIAKTADKDGVLADGAAAKIENNFVKPNDERVVAHTKLIGGGQEDTVTFDVSKLAAGEAYEYFCSFPGHYAMMNGKLTVK